MADPQRNQHRHAAEWTLQTVAAILSNPRYTGRQAWNRQEGSGRRSGTRDRRSVPSEEWAVSVEMAHPALVSEAEFVAVQHVRAARPTHDGEDRAYLLTGLLPCGVCGRRMDSHWAHGRVGYRCRHGRSSSRPRLVDGVKYVYVREDKLVSELVLAQEQLVKWEVALSNGEVTDTLNVLRSAGLVVVHDDRTWHLARSKSA